MHGSRTCSRTRCRMASPRLGIVMYGELRQRHVRRHVQKGLIAGPQGWRGNVTRVWDVINEEKRHLCEKCHLSELGRTLRASSLGRAKARQWRVCEEKRHLCATVTYGLARLDARTSARASPMRATSCMREMSSMRIPTQCRSGGRSPPSVAGTRAQAPE
jgi:hypothetical protein